MTWPPPRPKRLRVDPRPWDPGHPSDRGLKDESERLLYIVVDEVVEDWIGLSVSTWPDADSKGRLRFKAETGSVEIGTTRRSLREFLKTATAPIKSRLRVGFVFAARVRESTAQEFVLKAADVGDESASAFQDLGAWLERPTDLTKQARDVAKLAYYGALLSTLPEGVEERWKTRS
jgi:hypothetical protein